MPTKCKDGEQLDSTGKCRPVWRTVGVEAASDDVDEVSEELCGMVRFIANQ